MAFISAAKTSSGLRIRSFCANTHSSAWNRFWCCKNHRSTRVRRRFHIRSRRQCIRYSRASEHSTKDSTGVQSFSGTSILSSCRTNLGTFWAVILYVLTDGGLLDLSMGHYLKVGRWLQSMSKQISKNIFYASPLADSTSRYLHCIDRPP